MLYVQDQEGMAVIVVNWGEMTVSGGKKVTKVPGDELAQRQEAQNFCLH